MGRNICRLGWLYCHFGGTIKVFLLANILAKVFTNLWSKAGPVCSLIFILFSPLFTCLNSIELEANKNYQLYSRNVGYLHHDNYAWISHWLILVHKQGSWIYYLKSQFFLISNHHKIKLWTCKWTRRNVGCAFLNKLFLVLGSETCIPILI